jgi:undecaprenyl diphosphate synthase
MTPFPDKPCVGLEPRAPRHVGIIMDGNGRWAQARGLPRFEGHRRGVEAVRRAVRAAIDCGVSFLTIYSFSTENWSRPPEEVSILMGLLKRFIRNDLAELHANDVRVLVIGSREGLPSDIASLLIEAEELTRGNRGLTLVVAFNYGARQEIVEAARQLVADVASGRLDPREIDESSFESRLATAGIPDPDLIIRTSGEQRLSNFLLWQAAYAEFVFLPIHWPDFDKAAFQSALDQFAQRDRRFGGANSTVAAAVKSAS